MLNRTTNSNLAPIDVQQLPYEDIKGISGYTVGTKIYNNMDRDVFIGTRDGFRTSIKPMDIRGLTKGLYFITEHKISIHGKFDIDKLLCEEGNPYREHSVFRESRKNASDHMGISSLFILDNSTLSSSGGGYSRHLDMTISTNMRSEIIHPYSERGLLDYLEQDIRSEVIGGSLGIRVMVVDNHGTFGIKYINFGGLVHEIVGRPNPSANDGIYIMASSEITLNGERTRGEPRYFTFAELYEKKCPLIFFNSFQEAKEYGDIDSIRERKKKELEYASTIKTLEAQVATQKEKRKTDEIVGELEIVKRKQEHEYALRNMDRKDHYEERSHKRKDSSELWKLVPVVIGGAILFKKLLFD